MADNPFSTGRVILIDKPLNWTSFQVVNKVRWLIKKHYQLKKIKVGHAGTLDPLASGLLILCTGPQTKVIDTYQAQKKVYTGRFQLGATTPSYDLETEVNQTFDTSVLTDTAVKSCAKTFVGTIQQAPPIFSALKKDGKRLYDIARSGGQVEVAKRPVTIESFSLTDIQIPHIGFEIACSKGTYIRSIAHDFGQALNNGAHLTQLRRTQIGDFHVDQAQTIEAFEQALSLLPVT
jgi:tRNA pseudouridine55 synthase